MPSLQRAKSPSVACAPSLSHHTSVYMSINVRRTTKILSLGDNAEIGTFSGYKDFVPTGHGRDMIALNKVAVAKTYFHGLSLDAK